MRWTAAEIQGRGERLAAHALEIWPHHGADAASIQAADIRDLRERAVERNASELEMDQAVREVLDEIRSRIDELVDIIEVIERKSVCCYGPEFFAELMPMRHSVRVILPLQFSEVDIPEELTVYDASTWKFVVNRAHTDSDLIVEIWEKDKVTPVIPMIRQALDQSR